MKKSKVDKILSRNLRLVREFLGYSVEDISKFLDNPRYIHYESSDEIDRISINELENISSLYGIEAYELFDSKFNPSSSLIKNENFAISDMNEISKFNSIITDYIRLCNK